MDFTAGPPDALHEAQLGEGDHQGQQAGPSPADAIGEAIRYSGRRVRVLSRRYREDPALARLCKETGLRRSQVIKGILVIEFDKAREECIGALVESRRDPGNPERSVTAGAATKRLVETAADIGFAPHDVPDLLRHVNAVADAKAGVAPEQGRANRADVEQVAAVAAWFVSQLQKPTHRASVPTNKRVNPPIAVVAVSQVRSRESAGGARRGKATSGSSSGGSDDGPEPPGPADGSTAQHLALRHLGVERPRTVSAVATVEGSER